MVNYFSTFFFLTNLLSKLAQLSKLGTKRLFKSTEFKNCKHLVRLRASKCSAQVYHRAQGLLAEGEGVGKAKGKFSLNSSEVASRSISTMLLRILNLPGIQLQIQFYSLKQQTH